MIAIKTIYVQPSLSLSFLVVGTRSLPQEPAERDFFETNLFPIINKYL